MFYKTHHIFHNLPRIYIDPNFNNNIYTLINQYQSLPICYKGIIFCVTNGVISGIYYGITEFSSSQMPLSNVVQNVFNELIIGVLDSIIWPISIPYTICKNIDYWNMYMKRILCKRNIDYKKSSTFMNLIRFMYYIFY